MVGTYNESTNWLSLIDHQFIMLIFACECRDAAKGRAVLVDCSG